MHRRIIAIFVCLAFLLSSPGFAQDRDVSSSDLTGIRKSSSKRYFWAIAGGTAVGLGLGIIAPGGSKSAFKGALIGGSATSAFYLIKDPRAAGDHRAFAHIVTNTLLGTGIFWTVCDCKGGAWSGAFIGGGGTAIIQAFGTHNRSLAKMSGTAQSTPPADTPAAPGTPANTSQPANTTSPVVAGQQSTPAQPANQPAPAQAPVAQSAPVQPQNNQVQTTAPAAAQNPVTQLPNAPVAQQIPSAPASTQVAPATGQNTPTQSQNVTPAQANPAATQSVPASTQADPTGTQGTPAQNQNPPLLPEDLDFSSNSNGGSNLNIGSAALQPAPPRP